jgi:sigma-E factor negative regulatory protein RseA
MKPNNKQIVSELVDGEQSSTKSIDQIKLDQDLLDSFARYNLIGDLMRNDVPDFIDLDLTDKIAAAIDKEPVVLAPNSAFSAAVKESEQQIQAQGENKGEHDSAKVSWFKPVMQYGVAASFAMLMVLGLQTQPDETKVTPPVLNLMPVAPALEPVSIERSSPVNDVESRESEQKKRINAFIFDHSQQLKQRQQKEQNMMAEDKTENHP